MKQRKRILIIGGVAGGASAAARARRMSEEAEIVLFERGEAISTATCGFPYYISGVIPERKELFAQTPNRMAKRFNIEIRTNTEVIKINRDRKEILTRDLKTGEEKAEKYDALILSPGAEPVKPPIPGIESQLVFSLRSLSDADRIKNLIDAEKPECAVILGGGYIGLEMAEALWERKVKVILVELTGQVMSPIDPEMAEFLHQHLITKGVELRLKTSVQKISEKGKQLELELSTGEKIVCDLMILGVGVRPEVKLAKEAGLKIGETGGILVDEFMRTSDPDIYAVGDAVEITHLVGNFQTLIPLAGPANRQGRIAATNIFRESKLSYKKTQGTAICKVFDLTVAITGLNEKTLKRRGIAYEKIYLHPGSHASYYPGASPLRFKLLFDPRSGKILGAQILGTESVDKRIDVLAVALRAGMTVFDLEDLELAYAPPYGSAKDPVNMAGFVAANILRGEVQVCHTEEVMNLKPSQFLLDVRTRFEFQAGAIPGAVNIPVDDLRGRLEEIPKDKEILVYCATGVRSYLACRILKQNGYQCKNLSGGYTTYLAASGRLLHSGEDD